MLLPDLIWPGALTLLAAFGALSDIKWRRLPNWLALLLMALGLAHGFAGGGIEAAGWHALHMAIALAAGMGLFAIGAWGGGDAKFYAGIAAFFPLERGIELLLWVTLLGGALVIGWMAGRRVFPRLMGTKPGLHGKFPYGIAIAAGGIATAWLPFLPA